MWVESLLSNICSKGYLGEGPHARRLELFITGPSSESECEFSRTEGSFHPKRRDPLAELKWVPIEGGHIRVYCAIRGYAGQAVRG